MVRVGGVTRRDGRWHGVKARISVGEKAKRMAAMAPRLERVFMMAFWPLCGACRHSLTGILLIWDSAPLSVTCQCHISLSLATSASPAELESPLLLLLNLSNIRSISNPLH